LFEDEADLFDGLDGLADAPAAAESLPSVSTSSGETTASRPPPRRPASCAFSDLESGGYVKADFLDPKHGKTVFISSSSFSPFSNGSFSFTALLTGMSRSRLSDTQGFGMQCASSSLKAPACASVLKNCVNIRIKCHRFFWEGGAVAQSW
jgi:hypothetical protein